MRYLIATPRLGSLNGIARLHAGHLMVQSRFDKATAQAEQMKEGVLRVLCERRRKKYTKRMVITSATSPHTWIPVAYKALPQLPKWASAALTSAGKSRRAFA